jgi:Ala-tRNA(Pro) deacylase
MSVYLDRLKELLVEANAKFEVIGPGPAYTAQETAATAHVPGHTFAKSVIVRADDQAVLLVLPAPHVVDMELLRKRLGSASLRLSTENEIRDLFPDCEVGAIPPFAPGPEVSLYADEGLLSKKEISFNIGSHKEIARVRSEDYVRLASPRVLAFAVEPEPVIQIPPLSTESRRYWAAQGGWVYGAIAAAAALAVPVMTWRLVRSGALRRSLAVFAGGIAAGGTLVALADPRMGRRRRALVRDKGGHYLRLGLRRGTGASKRFRDRARGLQRRLRHRARTPRCSKP